MLKKLFAVIAMEENSIFELDEKNKQRSIKNILSKKNLSKYEMDQIFNEF